MSSLCPNCQSPRVTAPAPNTKRIAIAIGIVGGVVSGATTVLRQSGKALQPLPRTRFTSVSKAVLHGLTCCMTRYDLANQIVEKLSSRCLDCGHRFNTQA